MSGFGLPFAQPPNAPTPRRTSSYDDPMMSGNGVPMPMGSHGRTGSGQYPMGERDYGGPGSYTEPARSPPKSKNTSHVPCKFYPYGQCQAGASCQFSHDLNPIIRDAPCKYFAKGSCKFGQSCALAHILPDGRAVNRPPRGVNPTYSRRSTNPGIMQANGPPSLFAMQANEQMPSQENQAGFQQQDVPTSFMHQANSPMLGPRLYASDYSSPYGSPPGDARLASSPARGGLSALDAPLPRSFDSQGISQAARHGPFASSVPSRFGIESPPSSLPNKPPLGNSALRDSTFADTPNLDGVLHGLGSSPRENPALDFSKRPLHSERFARSRPVMMSSSLNVRTSHFNPDTSESDVESDDGAGEELLPSSLHDLLPQERLRRPSRNAMDDESKALPMLSAQRRAISNGSSMQEGKVGSLSPHSGSPSRYSSLWAAKAGNSKVESDYSTLGSVGSPLRPSGSRSSSLNPAVSSSSFNNKQGGMSMLTSQLQRTQLNEGSRTSQPPLYPATSRPLSNGSAAPRNGLGDRGFSSGSLGREKIDEEAMFSMEEDGDGTGSARQQMSIPPFGEAADGVVSARRESNPLTLGKGAATLGPIGGQRQGRS